MKKLIAYIILKSIIFLSFLSILTGSFEELSEIFEKELGFCVKEGENDDE